MAYGLTRQLRSGLATAALGVALIAAGADAAPGRRAAPAPQSTRARVAAYPAGVQRPTSQTLLSIGEGQLVTLPLNVKDVWTSNPEVADVYVRSAHQIYLFGKAFGEATVYATTADGTVAYSTNVRTSQNITSVDQMLKIAMPEADLHVTIVGQLAVLTGTVTSPADAAQAEQLVKAALNPGVDISSPTAQLKIAVVSRVRAATPLQVNLQVKIAEVSRSFAKNIGNNLTTLDGTSGFKFGVGSGRTVTSQFNALGGPLGIGSAAATCLPPISATGQCAGNIPGTAITPGGQRTTVGFLTKFLGLNLLDALDLGETSGQVTTLANPNLTVISGETSSFLAGGEIPIPVSQGLGAVSVEYKQYGVSLTYTATVLADGRINLRVRPEVSQLTSAGAVMIGNVQIPALTTRRAETTVELGSGQSMMIGGLLQHYNNNFFDKTPSAADLPVLGALFRSNAFQRNETELMIVVTPYLVKPVDANTIALPTDGYKTPTDAGRIFLGQMGGGQTGGDRPKPSVALPVAATPVLGAQNSSPMPMPAPAPASESKAAVTTMSKPKKGAAVAMPGFSGN